MVGRPLEFPNKTLSPTVSWGFMSPHGEYATESDSISRKKEAVRNQMQTLSLGNLEKKKSQI